MLDTDFEIKNPIIVRVLFYFFGILATITSIIFTIYLIVSKDASLWFLAILIYLFTLFSILGIYVCIREKFYLKAGIFGYIKPFKKSQFAKVEEIGYISLTYKKFLYVVEFYDKNNNILINFIDDGSAFKGGKFKKAIKELKIEFREVY